MTPAPSGSAPDDPDGFKETRREALLSPCLLFLVSTPLLVCLALVSLSSAPSHRYSDRMIMRVLASLLTGMLLATAANSTAPAKLLADGSGLNEGVLFATRSRGRPGWSIRVRCLVAPAGRSEESSDRQERLV